MFQWNVAGAALATVMAQAWRDMLAGIFSNDPTVIVRAAECLREFAPEAIVTAILFSFVGYYNGHFTRLISGVWNNPAVTCW